MLRNSAPASNVLPARASSAHSNLTGFSDSWLGGLEASHYRTLDIVKKLSITIVLLSVGWVCWFLYSAAKSDGPPLDDGQHTAMPSFVHTPASAPQAAAEASPSKPEYTYSRFGLWVASKNAATPAAQEREPSAQASPIVSNSTLSGSPPNAERQSTAERANSIIDESGDTKSMTDKTSEAADGAGPAAVGTNLSPTEKEKLAVTDASTTATPLPTASLSMPAEAKPPVRPEASAGSKPSVEIVESILAAKPAPVTESTPLARSTPAPASTVAEATPTATSQPLAESTPAAEGESGGRGNSDGDLAAVSGINARGGSQSRGRGNSDGDLAAVSGINARGGSQSRGRGNSDGDLAAVSGINARGGSQSRGRGNSDGDLAAVSGINARGGSQSGGRGNSGGDLAAVSEINARDGIQSGGRGDSDGVPAAIKGINTHGGICSGGRGNCIGEPSAHRATNTCGRSHRGGRGNPIGEPSAFSAINTCGGIQAGSRGNPADQHPPGCGIHGRGRIHATSTGNCIGRAAPIRRVNACDELSPVSGCKTIGGLSARSANKSASGIDGDDQTG